MVIEIFTCTYPSLLAKLVEGKSLCKVLSAS